MCNLPLRPDILRFRSSQFALALPLKGRQKAVGLSTASWRRYLKHLWPPTVQTLPLALNLRSAQSHMVMVIVIATGRR